MGALRFAGVGLVLIASISGCVGSFTETDSDPVDVNNGEQPGGSESSVDEGSPVTNAAEESPLEEPLLTAEWEDWRDGYTYRLEVQTAEASTSKDVANSRPGEVIVNLEYTVAGVLVNTTPERNAPMPFLTATPYWFAESAVCGSEIPDIEVLEDGTCKPMWPRFYVPPPNEPDIPAGSSTEFSHSKYAGDQGARFTVPEDAVDAVMEDLGSPDVWQLTREEGAAAGSTVCTAKPGYDLESGEDDDGCRAEPA